MAQPDLPHKKTSRIVIGFVVALAMGLLSPYLAIVPVAPVLFVFLYAYAGLIPALAAAVLTLGAYAVSFGQTGVLMGLAAHVAPAILIARGVKLRLPFFRQIGEAIAGLVTGIVLALAIAYIALGSDLVSALTTAVHSAFDEMEKVSPGFIDVLAARMYGISEAPESVTQEMLLSGFLTPAQRADYVDALLNDIGATLPLILPGYLLSMAALGGVLAVSWAGYVKRNEPDSTEVSYVPLAKWYTPYRLTAGLLLTLLASYIISLQKVDGGNALYMTIRSILMLVFMIQAAASIERRLSSLGARPWSRVIAILVIELLFGDLAVYYGGVSALIGTTGAFRQLMDKRANRS